MPSDQFDAAVPVVTQTRFAAVESSRKNMLAVRDMCSMGVFPGFNFSVAGGTAAQPAQHFYKKAAVWFKVDITWGANGSVSIATYSHSIDSGVTYDAIGTMSITYTADGFVSQITWT